MAKTNLERWHELQNANISNSTGYMNEFVSSENPLRTGGHVLNDTSIEEWSAKTTRSNSDNIGTNTREIYKDGEIILEEFPIVGVDNFADFS
tara:strand:+ start:1099 stop:1374 length:276 start_codon:yes stop_codon:yes gene_type:complete